MMIISADSDPPILSVRFYIDNSNDCRDADELLSRHDLRDLYRVLLNVELIIPYDEI